LGDAAVPESAQGASVLAHTLRWRALRPLRDRPFRLLIGSQSISLIGTGMAPIAVAFAVIGVHASALAMAVVLAARMVPTVIFMLVGGVLADRLPRHRLLIISNVVSAVAQAATAALLVFGDAAVWKLAALQFVGGAAGAFAMPALSGIVPQVIAGTYTKEANALLGMSRHGSRIGGAALGGAIVALFGPGLAVGVDALSFLAAALLLLPLRVEETAPAKKRPFVRELAEGWEEFRSRRWVWLISAQYAVTNALGMGSFFVLGPFIAEQSHGGAAGWGLIMTANAAGLVFGAAASLKISLERPLLAAPVAALFIVPVLAFLALGYAAIVVAFASFVLGFFASISGVFFETALQDHIPSDKLSRVAAYDITASFASIPAGVILIGIVATRVGTTTTLWVSAGIVAVAGIATLFAQDVRSVGAKPAEVVPLHPRLVVAPASTG
jgi:MFS family permease